LAELHIYFEFVHGWEFQFSKMSVHSFRRGGAFPQPRNGKQHSSVRNKPPLLFDKMIKMFWAMSLLLKVFLPIPLWMWYLLCPQSKSQVSLWEKSSKGLPRAFWDAVFWNAKALSCSPQIDQIMVVKRVRNDKVGAPPRGKLAADC